MDVVIHVYWNKEMIKKGDDVILYHLHYHPRFLDSWTNNIKSKPFMIKPAE